MMTSPVLRDFLVDGEAKGLFPRVLGALGPELPDYPDCIVMVTRSGGAGLNTDWLIDNRSFQVMCVGYQDVTGGDGRAEELADYMDAKMLGEGGSRRVGGLWVTSVSRVGGPPSTVEADVADRVHFVCDYSVDVESYLGRTVPSGTP